jgi:NADH-quinone oxidoreductase subunit L
MTFHGKPRADLHTMAHVHESPPVMTIPLILLAIGATVVGFSFYQQVVGPEWMRFWGDSIRNGPDNHVLESMHHTPGWVELAPSVVGLAGIALAYVMYMFVPGLPDRIAGAARPVHRFLLNKWYFDELYDFLFVRPSMALARVLWQVGDVTIIDGVPNGLASLTTDGSVQAVRLQTGSMAVYAFAMLIGVVVLSLVVLLILVAG